MPARNSGIFGGECSPAAGPRQTKLICFSGLRGRRLGGKMTKVEVQLLLPGKFTLGWLDRAANWWPDAAPDHVRVRLMLIMCCYQFPISWQN